MAILKLRRGTTSELSGITLETSEPFYNTQENIVVFGSDGAGSYITIPKLDAQNSGSMEFTGAVTSSNLTLTDAGTIPTSISSSGVAGTIKFDSSYIYICHSNNQWVRATLTTW